MVPHQHRRLRGQVSFPADANAHEAVESAKKLKQLALDVLTDLVRGMTTALAPSKVDCDGQTGGHANAEKSKAAKQRTEHSHEVGKIDPS